MKSTLFVKSFITGPNNRCAARVHAGRLSWQPADRMIVPQASQTNHGGSTTIPAAMSLV